MLKITSREQEILDLIQEECAEVIGIISKMRRFGPNSSWAGGDTNIVQLCKEIQDIKLLLVLLDEELEFNSIIDVDAYRYEKMNKLKRFTNL